MKAFEFKLDRFQVDQMFSAIRSKEDVITLWIRCIKVILAYVKPEEGQVLGLMRLHVDKMSRLFFVTDNKVFSINFPFFIEDVDGTLAFSSHSCRDVDNRVTSEVMALIANHKVLKLDAILEFADPFLDACEVDPAIWAVFRDLMLCEDGYIRFDHDPIREEGDHHPLDHLDIFYSTATTFKIGLRDRLSTPDFADILDIRTACHYLEER